MFTHIDDNNNPTIVDISDKQVTKRTAHARTIIELPESIVRHFKDGEIQCKKGPVFQTAIIAGIMGTKKTSELIPLCHPIGLENSKVQITLGKNNEVIVDCYATVHHKTGVEMEALTGASIAALTIYDMCKGMSKDIVIRETRLIEKRGGKSNYVIEEGEN